MEKLNEKISTVWEKLDNVSDHYFDLLFEVQSIYSEELKKKYLKNNELSHSLTQQSEDRFLEIKDVLQTEFFERFRQELYPVGMDNESVIPTKIDFLKIGMKSLDSK